MELRDWGECSVELASFSADQASGNLASRRVNNEQKLKPLRHVTGFSWNRKVTRADGSGKLSAITQRAVINRRAKDLAKALKMRLRRLWRAPPDLSIEDPHKWWNLIATAGLSGRASEEAWDKLFAELSELLISVLSDLAELGADQLRIVSDSEESNRLLGRLGRAAQASGDSKDFSERADPVIFVCRGRGAFQLAGAVTSDSAGSSEFGRSVAPRFAEPGLTMGECDSMGQRAEFRKVAESACSIEHIAPFAQAGAQLNVLKNRDSTLRAAASGMRRWAFFCDLAGRPHFPPTGEGVLAWPSFFGAGRSFRICAARPEEACLLLGVSTTW